MIPADIHDLALEGLLLLLLLAAPILAALLASGLLMSVLARFTHLSEPSLSFVARFVCVAAALMISLPWMASRVMEFTADLWAMLEALVS